MFNCRSEKHSILSIPLLKNPFIILSIVGAIALQIIFIKIPSLSMFLQVQSVETIVMIALFVMALPVLLIMELYKLIKYQENI